MRKVVDGTSLVIESWNRCPFKGFRPPTGWQRANIKAMRGRRLDIIPEGRLRWPIILSDSDHDLNREAEPGWHQGPPQHIQLLSREPRPLVTSEGREVSIWTLAVPEDTRVLSDWAAHFRRSYCLDDELDDLREGTGLSRREYLLQQKFPSETEGTGPGVRSGDFAELLITDYLEYILGYWTPRLKYTDKTNPNESKQGVDVVAFSHPNANHPPNDDELIAVEVKSRLSTGSDPHGLQKAFDGSATDYKRLAYTLNKTKQLFRWRGEYGKAAHIARFQNISDRPYQLRSGAAALMSNNVYDPAKVVLTTSTAPGQDGTSLMVIRGDNLMRLVHGLYERAADEA